MSYVSLSGHQFCKNYQESSTTHTVFISSLRESYDQETKAQCTYSNFTWLFFVTPELVSISFCVHVSVYRCVCVHSSLIPMLGRQGQAGLHRKTLSRRTNKSIYFYFTYMDVLPASLSLYHRHAWHLQRPKEVFWSSETTVK